MLYYNLLAAGIYKIFAVPQIASGFSFGYRRRAVFPAFRYMHDCYRVSIAKFKIFDKPVMHFRFNVGKCSKIFQPEQFFTGNVRRRADIYSVINNIMITVFVIIDGDIMAAGNCRIV